MFMLRALRSFGAERCVRRGRHLASGSRDARQDPRLHRAASAQWKKAINDAKFRQLCALEGDVLSRPPKGYDPSHPLIDDLKRKDFIAVTNLDQAEALSPSFTDRFTVVCVAALPLMR